MEKNKPVVHRIYDMLDEGKVSDLAEIKEYFLMLEKEQAVDFALASFLERGESLRLASWQLNNDRKPFEEYFEDFFGNRWYEVWQEGYIAQGNDARAIRCGRYFAASFRDAVFQYAEENYTSGTKRLVEKDGVISSFGCRFFDNEADARKSFG